MRKYVRILCVYVSVYISIYYYVLLPIITNCSLSVFTPKIYIVRILYFI